ncbi:MAG: DNA primase small subunit PriS [Thermoplasmata archaeon]
MAQGEEKEMQKIQPEEMQRLNFILPRFRNYYQQLELGVSDIPHREFAFMFFGKPGMVRHMSFTPASLKKFVVERVPAHIYYSSALYRKPDAKTMEEKGWIGADLIFDLDADHIPGSEKMSYAEMLAKVKAEFRKLVDDFLLNDFGFDEKDVKIVFSGGRGYHAHIAKDCVRKLGSNERREIVDYIAGTGLIEGEGIEEIRNNIRHLLDAEEYIPGGLRKDPKYPQKEKISLKLPSADSVGWRKRLREGIISALLEWKNLTKEEFLNMIQGRKGGVKGIGPASGKALYNELYLEEKYKTILEKGTLAMLTTGAQRALILFVVQKLTPAIGGETDEPVTSDIKRLIRLPFTLHGKTGLVVKEMSREEFEEFEPLRDAVPGVYSDKPVRVEILKADEIQLRGEKFSLREGITEVPEFAAMFLLCRGMAKLASGNT